MTSFQPFARALPMKGRCRRGGGNYLTTPKRLIAKTNQTRAPPPRNRTRSGDGPVFEGSKGPPLTNTPTEKIAESAKVLTASAVVQADSADRRTELAANRTVLAAERTYAAWIRTGIAILASGLGAKALLGDQLPGWIARGTGSIFVMIAGICFGIAVWRLSDSGAAPPAPDVPQIAPSLLAGIGYVFLLVVALALYVLWAF